MIHLNHHSTAAGGPEMAKNADIQTGGLSFSASRLFSVELGELLESKFSIRKFQMKLLQAFSFLGDQYSSTKCFKHFGSSLCIRFHYQEIGIASSNFHTRHNKMYKLHWSLNSKKENLIGRNGKFLNQSSSTFDSKVSTRKIEPFCQWRPSCHQQHFPLNSIRFYYSYPSGY